jgi:hypothetical protein
MLKMFTILSKHKRGLRLTPLIAFCNMIYINLYTNKCINSKRPTASVPAPTLITNSMNRSIAELGVLQNSITLNNNFQLFKITCLIIGNVMKNVVLFAPRWFFDFGTPFSSYLPRPIRSYLCSQCICPTAHS